MDIFEYIDRVKANFDKKPEPRYNMKKYFMGGSVTTPKRGLVDEPGSYAGKPVSKERLKFLNEAAKKFEYKDWNSVPKTKPIPGERAYGDREKIAQEATRRQKGVVEGKGKVKPTEAQKANIKKSHWANKSEAEVDAILNSPRYKEYWARKTQNQADLLEAVKSGKYKTSEEIRKAVGFKKDVFNKEVKNLFKNVYTQIGDLNKPKKMQQRFGVSFLPRDLDKMYDLRSKLGQIDGFESVEQRNIYQQIDEAYGQRGTNPNRKAFAEATKKASDFSRIKNAIKAKYPNIRLELDHPLDYKTIKGLGKGGEKFLFVTPVEKSINRGFKATLGDAYAKAVKAKDKANILRIENLAQDIGVTIGKVRGSKVMDYGTGPLRTTNLGDEIISNLRQQNVIVDNIKKLEKSGQLKTKLAEIGMPRAGEIGYSAKKISDKQIKNIENILATLGCGSGRLASQTGGNPTQECIARGAEKINNPKLIKKGAEARNAAQFLNRAAKIGRTVMKFGVIPEAIFVAGESLIRMGMGDTLSESLLRASDYLLPGNQTKMADQKKFERTVGPENALTIMRARDYKNAIQELADVEVNADIDIQQNMEDFTGISDQQLREIKEQRIKQATQNVKNKFVPEAVTDSASRLEMEAQDIAGTNNIFKKIGVAARNAKVDEIETLAAPGQQKKEIAPPMLTNKDLADVFITDEFLQKERDELGGAPELTKENVLNFYRGMKPEELQGQDNILNQAYFQTVFNDARRNSANQERFFGTQGLPFGEPVTGGVNIPTNRFADFKLGMYAGGGIAKLAGKSSGPAPEKGPTSQGLAFFKNNGRKL